MSIYGTYDPVYMFHESNQEGVTSTDIALEVSTGDTTFSWVCYWPMEVKYFGFFVSVAFAYDTQTAEGVIALDKRVTFGSDTGRVEVARIDLEDALAIGSIRYVVPSPTNVLCDPGDTLIVEVVTAGTGGGSIAGDFVPFVMCSYRPLHPGVNSDVVTGWTRSSYTQVV